MVGFPFASNSISLPDYDDLCYSCDDEQSSIDLKNIEVKMQRGESLSVDELRRYQEIGRQCNN